MISSMFDSNEVVRLNLDRQTPSVFYPARAERVGSSKLQLCLRFDPMIELYPFGSTKIAIK